MRWSVRQCERHKAVGHPHLLETRFSASNGDSSNPKVSASDHGVSEFALIRPWRFLCQPANAHESVRIAHNRAHMHHRQITARKVA